MHCFPPKNANVRLAAAVGCLALAGCWEEFRYAPPETAPAQVAAAGRAPADAAVEQPSEAPGPSAEAQSPPRRDELFGARGAAVPSGDAAASTAPASAEPVPSPADAVLPTPADTADLTAPLGPPPAEAVTESPPEASPATAAVEASPQQRALIWQAASKWSFAAALAAKGIDVSRYEPIRAEAVDAATQLAIELPPLPAASTSGPREAEFISLLQDEGPSSLAAKLAERFGPAERGLAELAIRSQLLLLTYSPRSSEAPAQSAALRAAGEASGVEAELWRPLAALLDQRAEFSDVKTAVFELHRRLGLHLVEAADDANSPASPMQSSP